MIEYLCSLLIIIHIFIFTGWATIIGTGEINDLRDWVMTPKIAHHFFSKHGKNFTVKNFVEKWPICEIGLVSESSRAITGLISANIDKFWKIQYSWHIENDKIIRVLLENTVGKRIYDDFHRLKSMTFVNYQWKSIPLKKFSMENSTLRNSQSKVSLGKFLMENSTDEKILNGEFPLKKVSMENSPLKKFSMENSPLKNSQWKVPFRKNSQWKIPFGKFSMENSPDKKFKFAFFQPIFPTARQLIWARIWT